MRKKIRERIGISITILAGIVSLLLGAKTYYDKIILLETERVKLRAQEEASDAINALLDDRNFGYAITDITGRIVEWNPALERVTGWTKKEIAEKEMRIHDIVPFVMKSQHYHAYDKAFASKEGRISIVECELPPHGSLSDPTKVRITVRVVTTRHGTKYAIAHIDTRENVIKKRIVVDFPERVLVPKKKKEEESGTQIRSNPENNVAAGAAGSQTGNSGNQF